MFAEFLRSSVKAYDEISPRQLRLVVVLSESLTLTFIVFYWVLELVHCDEMMIDDR